MPHTHTHTQVDKHLNAVCRKYLDTKFIKVNATEAPFFVAKLQIQVTTLPHSMCLCAPTYTCR